MSKTITTPVPVANNINNVTRWQVTDYRDHLADDVPSVCVQVQALGGGGKIYGTYSVKGYDSQNSTCLLVNPSPASQTDQLITGYRNVPNAYATITAAHDGAAGNNKAKLLAVEAVLVSAGLLDAALAGT